MTARLDPDAHDWMRAGPARAVMAALEAARPGGARFVGGCVRNALIGEPVTDIDIATQLTPGETIAALEGAGLKAVPTGIEHGTVTAVADGTAVEVTTLRRDVSTDGRRAVVAFTLDWTEDSGRRDFRLNAVYCAPDGTLFDPQGGVEDARERRIRFIGDADARIAEDGLRILRFFRLHAQYGRGRPDRDALLACARAKKMLDALSGERVWAEMKKLLSAEAPEAALRWMQTAEILRAAIGPCDGFEAAAQLSALRRENDWPRDAVLTLAALTGAGETRAESLAERLKLSRAERARLVRAARITCAKMSTDSPDEAEIAHETAVQLFREGPDAVADAARLCWARARARAAQDGARGGAEEDAQARRFASILERARNWTSPEFPISGNDLRDAGFIEGKSLGEVLSALQTRWIESKFTLAKTELMALADSLRTLER